MRKVQPKLAARYILGGVEKMILAAIAADEPIDLASDRRHRRRAPAVRHLDEEVRR